MMRFLPVNLDALLVELDDLPQTLALLASLQAEPIDGIEELVPAARTLLVRFRPAKVSQAALVERIGARSLTAQVERAATLIEIPVDYSGEDLDEVAQMLGISRRRGDPSSHGQRVHRRLHRLRAGLRLPERRRPGLNVPRRTTPRTRIPAGAVGLAGPFSGVYPQASPGGWQIIGVTATPMWDLGREVPALLQPGFRVRFIDMAGRPAVSSPASAPEPAAASVAVVPQRRRAGDPQRRPAGPVPGHGPPWSGGAGRLGFGRDGPGCIARGQPTGRQRQRCGLRGDRATAASSSVCRGEAVVAFTGADAPIDASPPPAGASSVCAGYQADRAVGRRQPHARQAARGHSLVPGGARRLRRRAGAGQCFDRHAGPRRPRTHRGR